MSKKKKLVVITFTVVLLIICFESIAIGYNYYLFSKVKNTNVGKNLLAKKDEKASIKNTQSDDSKNVSNILLIGTDNCTLADSIMILTVDRKNDNIKLSSIMRDSWVNIPGYGESKINASFSKGGALLLLRTINENYGLSIDKYVKVDFSKWPKIIDKLGGIDINITKEESDIMSAYIKDLNKINKTNDKVVSGSGLKHLSGTQAVAYCRVRYTAGNDFKRTERQRNVLNVLINNISKLSLYHKLSFLEEILSYVETNLKYSDIMTMSAKLIFMSNIKVKENRFPNDGDYKDDWSDGVYKIRFNKKVTCNKLKNFINNY